MMWLCFGRSLSYDMCLPGRGVGLSCSYLESWMLWPMNSQSWNGCFYQSITRGTVESGRCLFCSDMTRSKVWNSQLHFAIMSQKTKEHEYLFKRSHLLLDSVYKSPLYDKTKKKPTFHSFSHEPRKTILSHTYSS